MAERKESTKPDDEAVAATSRQYAGTATPGEPMTVRQLVEQSLAQPARNPVDFGAEVNVDDLPPCPPAGMFMAPEDTTEDLAPAPAPAEAAAGAGERKRG